MNSTLKVIISFIGGAGLGALGSALYLKKKYDDKLQSEIEAAREYYANKKPDVTVVDLDKSDEFDQTTYEKYKKAQEEYVVSSGSGPQVATRPNHGVHITTDYTKFLNDQRDEKERSDDSHAEAITKERAVERVRPPKIIREEEFEADPTFESATIEYYTENGVLVLDDEVGNSDVVISLNEVKDILADTLEKYGFTDPTNKQREMFVRNFRNKTDYRIIKIEGRYYDE